MAAVHSLKVEASLGRGLHDAWRVAALDFWVQRSVSGENHRGQSWFVDTFTANHLRNASVDEPSADPASAAGLAAILGEHVFLLAVGDVFNLCGGIGRGLHDERRLAASDLWVQLSVSG